jgi:hypothetical protein
VTRNRVAVNRAAERAGRYLSNSKEAPSRLAGPAQADLGRDTLVTSNECDGRGLARRRKASLGPPGPLLDEGFHTLGHAEGTRDLIVILHRCSDAGRERRLPYFYIFQVAHVLLGSGKAPALFKECNYRPAHLSLGLFVLAERVEQLAGEVRRTLPISVEGLEAANEAVGRFAEPDRARRDPATHRKTYLLIRPFALVEFLMEQGYQGIACRECRFDLCLPLLGRFDVIVRDETGDATRQQRLLKLGRELPARSEMSDEEAQHSLFPKLWFYPKGCRLVELISDVLRQIQE